MEWIVDRISGNEAVIEGENGGFFRIPLGALPSGISEGDLINVEINREKTELRREKIKNKMPK